MRTAVGASLKNTKQLRAEQRKPCWQDVVDLGLLTEGAKNRFACPSPLPKAPISRCRLLAKGVLKNNLLVDVYDRKALDITGTQFRSRMQKVVEADAGCRPSRGLSEFMLKRRTSTLPAYALPGALQAIDDPNYIVPCMTFSDHHAIRTMPHRLLALVNGRPAGFATLSIRFIAPRPGNEQQLQGISRPPIPSSADVSVLRLELHLNEAYVGPSQRKLGMGDFLSEAAAFLFLQLLDSLSRRTVSLAPIPSIISIHAQPASAAGLRLGERTLEHLSRLKSSKDWHLDSLSIVAIQKNMQLIRDDHPVA